MGIPNPYPWYRTDGDKNYILVTKVEENEVIKLIEASALDSCGVTELSKKIEDKYLECLEKYPFPEYDIISTKAESIKEVAQVFGVEDGFAGTEQETIS